MHTLMVPSLWFLGSCLFGVFAGRLSRFSQACDRVIECRRALENVFF